VLAAVLAPPLALDVVALAELIPFELPPAPAVLVVGFAVTSPVIEAPSVPLHAPNVAIETTATAAYRAAGKVP
jgi:hypothetical protein